MKLCAWCGVRPRRSGRGYRYCSETCRGEASVASQDQAMARFKARNPDYWQRRWAEGRW